MSNTNSWNCYLAWKSFYRGPCGTVKPCCRFSLDKNDLVSLPSGKLPHEQGVMKAVRQSMLEGRIPAGCQRCADEEKSQVPSKRQRTNKYNSDNFSESPGLSVAAHDITHIEWFLGNLCNLRCVTCSPRESTGWNSDATAVDYPVHPQEVSDSSLLKPYIHSLKNLLIIGGEPFLSPQLTEILEIISAADRAGAIELTISTNLTTFPDEKILNYLSRFQSVRLEISLDSTGERNDYIRYPSKWTKQNQNAQKLLQWAHRHENIHIVLTTVVSAYSLGGLPELLKWWTETQQACQTEPAQRNLVLNHLALPSFQAAHVLPRSVRESILQQFDGSGPYYEAAMATMDLVLKKDDPAALRELREWTLRLEQRRQLHAAQIIPEIFLEV
jgi:sulfatase maturation enzyme AslB (radical SAM superfamily)